MLTINMFVLFYLFSLRFGKHLGRGAFGQVMQAEALGIIEPEKYTTVAVKMLKG